MGTPLAKNALSRRRFLTTGAGVGTVLAVPGLLGAPDKNAAAATGENNMDMDMSGHDAPDAIGVRSVPFTEGAPLAEPEVRRSAGGELRTTLRLQYAYKDVGGYRLFMRTYEGTIPGPTLRLRRGDILRIRLVNDLPPNRDPMPANIDQPHHLNTTNLHLHGSHVSPSGIADNVMPISRLPSPPITPPAPIGITRIIMAAPMFRWRAAWPGPSSSKGISTASRKLPPLGSV